MEVLALFISVAALGVAAAGFGLSLRAFRSVHLHVNPERPVRRRSRPVEALHPADHEPRAVEPILIGSAFLTDDTLSEPRPEPEPEVPAVTYADIQAQRGDTT